MPRSAHLSRPFREWLALGAILAVYQGLLAIAIRLPAPAIPWASLLAPNVWLLAASALWARRGGSGPFFSRGRRVWLGSGLLAGLVALVVAVGATRSAQDAAGPDCGTGPALVVILLVPVAEELYFRGILFAHLRRLWGGAGATLLTTTLFVLLHAGQGPRPAAGAAVLALACSAMTLACSTVLWAVAVHVAWNALALGLGSPCRAGGALVAVSSTTGLLLILAWAWRRGGTFKSAGNPGSAE
jgi:membrane protease YdiL (CAAX protease family)